MFLHVLRHVYPDHVLLGIEECLGKGAGKLGLPHTGGTKEYEGAHGSFGILYTRPGPEHGVCHKPDRLVLADYPLVKDVVEAKELFPLTFQEP